MKKVLMFAAVVIVAGMTQIASANPLVKYACSGCHGMNGEGTSSAPALKGLSGDYVVAQLQAFQNGSRQNPVMQPMSMMARGHEQEIAEFIEAIK